MPLIDQTKNGKNTSMAFPAREKRSASSANIKFEDVENEVLKADPISKALSGGGGCRYCVEKCKEG